MLFFIVAALVIAADQITKAAALYALKPVPTVPLIEGVFHLTYVENRGAAFGILQDQRWIFIVLTLLVLALLLWAVYGKKIHSRMFVICCAALFGGAAGNMIDRVFRGFVVDLFDFRLIHFPVFNVADICVCVSVIFAGIYLLFLDKEKTLDKLFERKEKP